MARSKKRRRDPWRRRFREIEAGAQNALDILKLGRLGERQAAPFEVLHEERVYRLRHYQARQAASDPGAPLLLIPPLMLTAEIYDVAPEVSTTWMLTDAGVDTWVVDFGAPERQEGGLERTVDDHVRAVSDAVRRIRKIAGRDVHVAGYSQGGMFAYQAAAFVRSKGLASVITFGAPVDIHRSIPSLDDALTARLIGGARRVLEVPIQRLERLPGMLSSIGFKLTSPRKEIRQIVDFFQNLNDRQALQKREDRRRFLAGEGFVSWPGPAFRQFVDEFIVHNRMMSGGFVIDGRTVTLADIDCPILAFVGERDDIARPPTVRAITTAAPNAEVFQVGLPAGHFGLVVGTTARTLTWPSVVSWIRWREGTAGMPDVLKRQDAAPASVREVEDAAFDEPLDFELVTDAALGAVSNAWKRLGEWTEDAAQTVDSLRWQIPRVARLARIQPHARLSFGKAIADQSKRIPDRTFFLWRDRAFSYADADRRVSNVAAGLLHVGVRRHQRIGVLMRGRPSFLTAAAAVNRVGGVAVLMDPSANDADLEAMVALGRVDFVLCDPDHAARARSTFSGPVLVLGGGGKSRKLVHDVVDMEAIDLDSVDIPDSHRPNPGRASEVALQIFTRARSGELRAAEITNRRWAFSAYGAAAGCTLSAKDTVYTVLPLHHPTGFLVSVGSAIVSGSRLALASDFTPDRFWQEVRRYGATVVFYAGDSCRVLVNAPSTAAERNSSLRLFAGSGMRPDVWRRVLERFTPAGVLEFYASTEGASVLVNASGRKIGSLGRPLPGSAELAVVEYDFSADELRRRGGRLVRCRPGVLGMLLARLDPTHPKYSRRMGAPRILRDAFEDGDAWFVTLDLVRVDEQGDYWFVDRLGSMLRTDAGPVSPRAIEDTLYRIPSVGLAAAYGVQQGPSVVPVASVVLREGELMDPVTLAQTVTKYLEPAARPMAVRVVDRIQMTGGFRTVKEPLRATGVDGPGARQVLHYRDADAQYV